MKFAVLKAAIFVFLLGFAFAAELVPGGSAGAGGSSYSLSSMASVPVATGSDSGPRTSGGLVNTSTPIATSTPAGAAGGTVTAGGTTPTGSPSSADRIANGGHEILFGIVISLMLGVFVVG
jgi:hypothetical protein